MDQFNFSPVEGFKNSTLYPNPTNEAETREQLQKPLDQIKDFINLLLETLQSESGIDLIGSPDGSLNKTIEKLFDSEKLTEILSNYAKKDLLTGKLDKNLGIIHAGKILYINEQGVVTPTNFPQNDGFDADYDEENETLYLSSSSGNSSIHGYVTTTELAAALANYALRNHIHNSTEIDGLPKNLSEFNNDANYLTKYELNDELDKKQSRIICVNEVPTGGSDGDVFIQIE